MKLSPDINVGTPEEDIRQMINRMTIELWCGTQRTTCLRPAFLFRKATALAVRVILGFTCASLSSCALLGYERDTFATDHVRVIHSERHCKAAEQSVGGEVPDAELVLSGVHGLGYLVATKTAWEVLARQLAAELDGDISLVRPCDGASGHGFKYAQIQVWRTRGFSPIVHEELPPPGITLSAPSGATYGARLRDILDCLEKSLTVATPLSAENKARLAGVNATDFFSSERHFPGYANIDRHFRPTRSDSLRLSMIESNRGKADWAAGRYGAVSPDSRLRYAEQYLICLLDRGYSW